MDKICVVGLGYVGLPLALSFAKTGFGVIGFDIKESRVNELKEGIDSTCEIPKEELNKFSIFYTSNQSKIKEAQIIIVAVPTPIGDKNIPDLNALKEASKLVGRNLSEGSIVVFESTVYPGVTEDICVPIIEKESKFKCGKEFKVGYSPERINPGDKEHTIDKVVKIVSGMDKETIEKLAEIYGKITKVFKTKNIKTAEAAKVIENVQRDLNIALMNELSLIFSKLGLNTLEVIEAAATKWNFHKYIPGLVGGHCIPVDPYYLTFKAKESGYLPKIILAGREINNYMSQHIVKLAEECLKEKNKVLNGSKILLLGLTFKENVNDCRNSRAKDILLILKESGSKVFVFDPLLENSTIEKNFGVRNVNLDTFKNIDCVILISPHNHFEKITLNKLYNMMGGEPALVDVKSFYDAKSAKDRGFSYRCL